MKHYKFSRKLDQEFSKELRKRVNNYFRENRIKRSGNAVMKIKVATALLLYFGPFIALLSLNIHSIAFAWLLWIVMGFGKAFMGTSVMHDALHGTLSGKKPVNRILGFSSVLLGADARMWKIQHNVLHHTYTNIENADEDMQVKYILRFSPNQPKYWFHKYQHLYAGIFYSISTLFWATAKDFIKLENYRKKGIVKTKSEYRNKLLRISLGKLLYFGVFLALPLIFLPFPAWITILMFISMHVVAGFSLSLIFQLAHIVPTSSFVKAEGNEIEENWSVHQLLTTSNFAPKSKLVRWFSGGLNFQIEHHLFPNICHIHYPKISKIVRETAQEFGTPYYIEKTFYSAIRSHFRMLKDLGRQEKLISA